MERECQQTFDGKHHYGPRRWLKRNDAGGSLDPTVSDHWFEEWACVCSKLAPTHLIPSLRESMKETNRVKSRRWGVEKALQGSLDL